MSLKKDDMDLHEQPAIIKHELQKQSKISYTRDFLLSLSELDICQKLPSGFDQSIISEFEDASQDRQRTSGGLSLNSFRRNEYGSSPPNRAETNNYSRRIHGKREVHSSGRSDKDSDSQSDKDSVDSGWRYGDQSRRPWQSPEHDGLLGSGSFPRPSGYAAGLSASKARANDHYQLNKSNEPYHPPRPYKAVAHPRRETNDSYNHETFGSSECTSEDRVEEEKKRRASFELMRKEQHKAFQESQKFNPVKRIDEFEIIMQLDDTRNENILPNTSSGLDEHMTLPASKNDPEKSIHPQTTVCRPLVPPGFTSTVLEKNFNTKSSNLSHFLEIGKENVTDKCLQTNEKHLHNGISEDSMEKKLAEQMCTEQLYGKTSIDASTNNTSEKIVDLFSAVDMPNNIIGMQIQCHENSLDVFEASENSAVVDSKAEKVPVNTVIGESKGNSSSILEKLFGSALKLEGGATNFIEHGNDTDGACSPQNAQSSKFAHWFLDNDRKQDDDVSPRRSNNLLTLIVGEKGGNDVTDLKNHSEQSQPAVAFQNFKSAESYITSTATSSNVANSDHYGQSKPEAVSAILTCEDVEQSLLSRISENDSALLPSDQGLSYYDADDKRPIAKSDDHASQHLLSLLQKGVSPMTGGYGDDGANIGTALHNAKQENTRNVSDPGKSLTLETLFGSAFMKELQSVGAPVSVQRGSSGSAKVETIVDGSESREFSHPNLDDGLLPKSEIGHNMINHDHGVMALKQRQPTQPETVQRQWLNFTDARAESDSSYHHVKLGPNNGGYDGGPAEIPLREEDSLIISDSMNFRNLISVGNSTKTQPPSSSHHKQNDNAAIFNPVYKDERSGMGGLEGVPFSAGPYNRREIEIPHRNVHVHSSFSQAHPQTNNVKLFHHLESHPPDMKSQMEFMSPEGIVHRDSPSNHPFIANLLRPPTTALSGFDHSVHHPMMQQMQTSVNLPPQHLLQGLSRGAPLPITGRNGPVHPHPIVGGAAPPQPNNQITGLMQELNPMQGFHIGQRLPNFGGPGLPSPATDVGGIGNHPDAIQRLIQMGQNRSNSKQSHGFSGSGHGQGMYGHELNMGYGYR